MLAIVSLSISLSLCRRLRCSWLFELLGLTAKLNFFTACITGQLSFSDVRAWPCTSVAGLLVVFKGINLAFKAHVPPVYYQLLSVSCSDVLSVTHR